MRRLSLIAALLAAATAPAGACAVATSIQVENRSGRTLLAAFLEDEPGHNQLPRQGLRPGGTATITLPSCMGTYTVVTVLVDGTRIRHTGLDATTIRGITVR